MSSDGPIIDQLTLSIEHILIIGQLPSVIALQQKECSSMVDVQCSTLNVQ
jgi:hypothetical protein